MIPYISWKNSLWTSNKSHQLHEKMPTGQNLSLWSQIFKDTAPKTKSSRRHYTNPDGLLENPSESAENLEGTILLTQIWDSLLFRKETTNTP